MRILVLDDDLRRHQVFAQNLRGHDVTHAHTYDDAIKAVLNEPRFELYFLDHDLNDFGQRSIGPATSMYGGVREMTGSDFANFIVQRVPSKRYPDVFVVHSVNPAGAANMVQVLKRTGLPVVREPFHVEIGR